MARSISSCVPPYFSMNRSYTEAADSMKASFYSEVTSTTLMPLSFSSWM